MTDKEIIKALECCYRKDVPCRDCPFNEFEDCNDVLMADYVFNLIKRQQAEIERLENEVKLLTQNSITERFPHCVLCGNGAIITKSLEDYDKIITNISSEAVKEFQKRLKALYTDDLITDDMHCPIAVIKANIDDIAEEMVGKINDNSRNYISNYYRYILFYWCGFYNSNYCV